MELYTGGAGDENSFEPRVLRHPGCPKTSLMTPRGVPNEHLGHPRSPKRDPSSPRGAPKSIGMARWNPLDHKADPRRKRDLEPNSKDQPFLPLWPPVGAPRSHFGSKGGPKMTPKSTWGGKVGTFGGQGGPKGSSKGGPKMGSKK